MCYGFKLSFVDSFSYLILETPGAACSLEPLVFLGYPHAGRTVPLAKEPNDRGRLTSVRAHTTWPYKNTHMVIRLVSLPPHIVQ